MSDSNLIIIIIIILFIILAMIIGFSFYNDRKNERIRNKASNIVTSNTPNGDGLFQSTDESRDSNGHNPNYKANAQAITNSNIPNATIAQSNLPNHKTKPNTINQSHNQYAKLCNPVNGGPTIETLRDLAKHSSSGLDGNYDYMVYVTLTNFVELLQYPRFTSGLFNSLFLGYRKDTKGLEKVRPIPKVEYSGFIIVLQALSRSVTAQPEQLQEFTDNVNKYLELIGSKYKLECDDVNQFMSRMNKFKEIRDELDKVISVYFQSPHGISPMVFSAKMKSIGFKLDANGIFNYSDKDGNNICYACTTNSTPFRTDNDVNNGDGYNEFQLIFDIPLIKDGEKRFQYYIDCCTNICKELGEFRMVNEQGEEISEALLSEVKNYVADIQEKMKENKIPPGSDLAKRLFLN